MASHVALTRLVRAYGPVLHTSTYTDVDVNQVLGEIAEDWTLIRLLVKSFKKCEKPLKTVSISNKALEQGSLEHALEVLQVDIEELRITAEKLHGDASKSSLYQSLIDDYLSLRKVAHEISICLK